MSEPTVRELLLRRKISPGPRTFTNDELQSWAAVAASGDPYEGMSEPLPDYLDASYALGASGDYMDGNDAY